MAYFAADLSGNCPRKNMNWLNMTSTGHGDRANNLVRYGRAIVHCLSSAVLVTWLNSAWAGTIKVDDCPASLLQRGVIGTLLTLSLAAAAFFFLKAWLAAARQPLDGLLPIALLLHVICFLALPSTTNDVFSNITFGRELLAGLNPYHDVPSGFGTDPIVEYMGSIWLNTPSVYGPLANLVSGLAAWPPGVWAPMLLFKLFMLACSLGSILLGYDFCRSCLSPKWAAPAFLVLAWNPLLAWDVSSQAHNDGLLVLAFSAFVWAASRKRQWLAAAALIVGFYFKFATLPLIGLYGLYVGRCRPLRCLLMGAGPVVAGVVLFAPFWRGTATLHPTLLASTGRHDYASNSLYWLVREIVCIVHPAIRTHAVLAVDAGNPVAMPVAGGHFCALRSQRDQRHPRRPGLSAGDRVRGHTLVSTAVRHVVDPASLGLPQLELAMDRGSFYGHGSGALFAWLRGLCIADCGARHSAGAVGAGGDWRQSCRPKAWALRHWPAQPEVAPWSFPQKSPIRRIGCHAHASWACVAAVASHAHAHEAWAWHP